MAAPRLRMNPNVFDFSGTKPGRDPRTGGEISVYSHKDKLALEGEVFAKYRGQTLQLVNTRTGEVRPMQLEGVRGINMIQHVLWGLWKIASAEQVAAAEVKEREN